MAYRRMTGWQGIFSSRLDNEDDAKVGAIFKEYLRESIHEGWDGFEPHQMTGVNALLADFRLFFDHYLEPESETRAKAV